MAKWADYLISAVRYNKEETHIEKVKVHVDNGDSVGVGNTWDRKKVVEKIEDKKTFVTITKNSSGKRNKGDNVGIVKVNNIKYIRTDGNSKDSDNLGSLPEF